MQKKQDLVYSIKGIKFIQHELTYEEDGILFEIIKTKFPTLEIKQENSMLSAIEEVLNSGILLPVLNIILKPKKNFSNKFLKWKYKLNDEKDILKHTPNSTIVQILKDFFLLNLKWTENLTNLNKI